MALKAMFIGIIILMIILGFVVVIVAEKIEKKAFDEFKKEESKVEVTPEEKKEPKPKRKAPVKKVKKD